MSWLRRVVDMIANKPIPPDDERSKNAVLIEEQKLESDRVLRRADKAIPEEFLGSYRRVSALHRRR